MRVSELAPSDKAIFEGYVQRMPPSFFFFTYDLVHNPDKARVMLAIEGEMVRGSMLIFNDAIVQLRGSRKAARCLLERLDVGKAEIQLPKGCEDLLYRHYSPTQYATVLLMVVEKGQRAPPSGEERLIRLGPERAGEVSALMRRTYPEFWGGYSEKDAARSLQNIYWLGIEEGGSLACIGSAHIDSSGGHVAIIATREDQRNKGLATAMTSALVRKILEVAPYAIIYADKANAPAVRAYTKSGFHRYQEFAFVRAKRKPG